jgi:hypothetical protein
MMKLTRLVLVCTLLLLASAPVFALPQCGDCINNECVVPSPGSVERCGYDQFGNCVYIIGRCSPSFSPVSAEWTVVSIEIKRPEVKAEKVEAPAEKTEAPAAKVTAAN